MVVFTILTLCQKGFGIWRWMRLAWSNTVLPINSFYLTDIYSERNSMDKLSFSVAVVNEGVG